MLQKEVNYLKKGQAATCPFLLFSLWYFINSSHDIFSLCFLFKSGIPDWFTKYIHFFVNYELLLKFK